MNRSSLSLISIILTLVIGGVVLASAAYTIDEAEQAIVVQFGAPVGETINEPGLHFKVPFIQEVRRFDKRLLSWDGDPNQIPTRGEQFISVDTTARWRIVDPLTFLRSVQNERGATLRLNDILDSVVRDQISATDLVEIVRSKDWEVSEEDLQRAQAVSEGDEEILRQRIARGRQELTKDILEKASVQMPDYGIELVDIRIKRIDYVSEVQERVFERMIAERQRIAEQFRSEGQGRAAEIDGVTQQQLAQIRSEATRQAELIRGEADAEATRVYNEAFGADPEFFSFFRSLESYSRSIGEKSTLFLGPDSDYVRYLRDANPSDE